MKRLHELGVSEDEYLNWQSQLKVTNVVSLNEFVEQEQSLRWMRQKFPFCTTGRCGGRKRTERSFGTKP